MRREGWGDKIYNMSWKLLEEKKTHQNRTTFIVLCVLITKLCDKLQAKRTGVQFQHRKFFIIGIVLSIGSGVTVW